MLKSIKAVSSLEKIFIDSDVSDLTELKRFSMLKNEKKSFQIALDITDSEVINIQIFYFLFPKAVLLTLQEPSPFGLKFLLAGKNFYRAATTISQ